MEKEAFLCGVSCGCVPLRVCHDGNNDFFLLAKWREGRERGSSTARHPAALSTLVPIFQFPPSPPFQSLVTMADAVRVRCKRLAPPQSGAPGVRSRALRALRSLVGGPPIRPSSPPPPPARCWRPLSPPAAPFASPRMPCRVAWHRGFREGRRERVAPAARAPTRASAAAAPLLVRPSRPSAPATRLLSPIHSQRTRAGCVNGGVDVAVAARVAVGEGESLPAPPIAPSPTQRSRPLPHLLSPLPPPTPPPHSQAAEPRKRTFRKFSYRGVDLEQLLELPTEELVKLFGARQRRR